MAGAQEMRLLPLISNFNMTNLQTHFGKLCSADSRVMLLLWVTESQSWILVVFGQNFTICSGWCAVSIAVLVIVLLTTKRKAWGNLTKRVYLANILYTLLYSTASIAAVNYSRPPSQETTWCEAMGFILQYSGTLVIVHYLALALTIVLQVTLPV